MSDKPKRKWFRIHLSTAFVLMLVASVLLCAQLEPKATELASSGWSGQVYSLLYGWPAYYSDQTAVVAPADESSATSDTWDNELKRGIPKGLQKSTWKKRWLFKGVAINLAAALAMLGFVAFVCEWFIRRREEAREREAP